MTKPFAQEKWIYLLAIAGSVLLSLCMLINGKILNPDGICYVLSAKAISEHGISSAMHLCDQARWPFYSFLIYLFTELSHFSFPVSAQILDAIFSLVSVVTFITIIKELGGSQRLLWLAAIVILFAHGFNDVRGEVIRDHGFWAFYLLSIFTLLQYFRHATILNALAWSVSLIIASLFRVEGFIFLLLIPFAVWLRSDYTWSQRLKMFLQLNSILVLLVCPTVIWWLLHPNDSLQFGRLSELIGQIQNGLHLIIERFQHTKTAIGQYVLDSNSARDAGIISALVLLVDYIVNVMSALSWIYALLLVYALHRKVVSFTTNANCVLFAYIIVNVIFTFVFFSETLFLAQRYLIALTLVLMCWLPFVLNHIIQLWPVSQRHRELITLTLLAMVVTSVSGLFHLGYSKAYIQTAGSWLAENVPADASLYVNDEQVMYYSQHFGNDIFSKIHTYADLGTIAENKWKQYNYVALRLGNTNDANAEKLLQEINFLPIQTFSNKRGDKVVVYKIT